MRFINISAVLLFCFSALSAMDQIKSRQEFLSEAGKGPMLIATTTECELGMGFVDSVSSNTAELKGVSVKWINVNDVYTILQSDMEIDLGDLVLIKDAKAVTSMNKDKESPFYANKTKVWLHKTLKKYGISYTFPEPEPDFLDVPAADSSADLSSGLSGVYPLTSDFNDTALKDKSSFRTGAKNKIVNGAFYMDGIYGYTEKGEYVDRMYNEGTVQHFERPKSGFAVFLNLKPEAPKKDGRSILFVGGRRLLRFDRDPETGKLTLDADMECYKCGKNTEVRNFYTFNETVELNKWHSFAVSADFKAGRVTVIMNGKRLKDVNLGKKFSESYFRKRKSLPYDEDVLALDFSGNGSLLKGYAKDMITYDRPLTGNELKLLYEKYAVNGKTTPAVVVQPITPVKNLETLNKALIKAARHDDPTGIETAVKEGAEVNYLFKGWSALMFAANHGCEECVRVLIKNHADPLIAVNNWNAQRLARKKGFDSIVKLLEDYSNTGRFFSRRKINVKLGADITSPEVK